MFMQKDDRIAPFITHFDAHFQSNEPIWVHLDVPIYIDWYMYVPLIAQIDMFMCPYKTHLLFYAPCEYIYVQKR